MLTSYEGVCVMLFRARDNCQPGNASLHQTVHVCVQVCAQQDVAVLHPQQQSPRVWAPNTHTNKHACISLQPRARADGWVCITLLVCAVIVVVWLHGLSQLGQLQFCLFDGLTNCVINASVCRSISGTKPTNLCTCVKQKLRQCVYILLPSTASPGRGLSGGSKLIKQQHVTWYPRKRRHKTVDNSSTTIHTNNQPIATTSMMGKKQAAKRAPQHKAATVPNLYWRSLTMDQLRQEQRVIGLAPVPTTEQHQQQQEDGAGLLSHRCAAAAPPLSLPARKHV